LLRFAETLSQTVELVRDSPYGRDVQFRLLVSQHTSDKSLYDENFQLELVNAAKGIDVKLVLCNASNFHRAGTSNSLLREACQEKDCIVTLMDVDMEVRSSFIFNSLTFVHPQAAAYFPIVFSGFNPEAVRLVDHLVGHDEPFRRAITMHKEQYRGLWRNFGFGMWAMSGFDAIGFRLNDKFKGWGGEDVDFYKSCIRRLNIIRLRESGLVHIWHHKECKIGSFVEDKMYRNCITSAEIMDGTVIGSYLLRQAEKEEKCSSTCKRIGCYRRCMKESG
jgi:hypothetical protein